VGALEELHIDVADVVLGHAVRLVHNRCHLGGVVGGGDLRLEVLAAKAVSAVALDLVLLIHHPARQDQVADFRLEAALLLALGLGLHSSNSVLLVQKVGKRSSLVELFAAGAFATVASSLEESATCAGAFLFFLATEPAVGAALLPLFFSTGATFSSLSSDELSSHESDQSC